MKFIKIDKQKQRLRNGDLLINASKNINKSAGGGGGGYYNAGEYLPASGLTDINNDVYAYLITNDTKWRKSIELEIPKTIKDASGNSTIVTDESGNTEYESYIVINDSGITVDDYKVITEEWFYKDDDGNIHCKFNFVGDNEIAAYGSGDTGPISITIIDNLESISAIEALSANQGRVLNEKINELSGNTKLSTLKDVNITEEELKDKLVLTYDLESKKWIAKDIQLPSGITEEKIQQWDSAYTHTTNEEIHVTTEEKEHWNNTYSTVSGITNFDVLSGITDNDISTWNTVSAKTDLTAFTEHIDDKVIHITNNERNAWNEAYNKRHEHSNKDVLDTITSSYINNWNSVYNDWCDGFYYDGNGNLHAKINLIGDKEVSAYGKGDSTPSGIITIVDNLNSELSDAALSARQGKVLKELIDNKTIDLKDYYNKSEIDTKLLSKSDSGHTHAISGISGLQAALNSKSDSGHTHTWNSIKDKPTSFPASVHTHEISDVMNLQDELDHKSDTGHTHSWDNITNKPSTFKPSTHGHAISDVSGLQATLDSKVGNTAFNTHTGNTTLHITSDERTKWNNAYNNSHTHDNKEVIDSISDEDIKNWNTSYNQKHTHSNKSVIDSITQQNLTNWTYAYNKSHEHDNKDILDAIDSTDISNWNDAYNKRHSHTNKSVLDTITSTKVSNWDSVYSEWNEAFYIDNNGVHARLNLIGDGEVSAYGKGDSTPSGIITIVDNLNSELSDAALSARQGKVLKELIDNKTIDLTNYYKKSEIDTKLSNKSDLNHTHAISGVTGLQSALDSKSSTSHTHNWNSITNKPSTYPAATHQHEISDITNLQDELDHKASYNHTHAISGITGLQSTLDGKSSTSHTHHYSAITALSDVLAKKSDTGHTHAWSTITNKPTSFTPSEHDHSISDITNLQSSLDSKANSTALTSHTSNSTIHITSGERDDWNTAYNRSHTHSNKTTLDSITSAKVSNWDSVYSDWNKGFYYDSNGNLHARLNLVGDKEIAAYGSGDSQSGVITIVDNLNSTASDAALSANQGRILKNLIDNKTVDLTSYYKKNEIDTILKSYASSAHTHTISNINGLQAALDGKSSTAHTHSQYSLSSHTHSQYSLTSHTHNWNSITDKPSSFPAATHQHDISDVTNLQDELDHKASISHNHAISGITGLQSALDGKSSTSHTHHYSAITALSDVLATKSSTGHTHAWSTITNKPTTFTPSEHDHEISNITGLQSALNNKAASSALTSHTSNSTVHITSDERTKWNDASNKAHSHSNKSVLDGITSAKVNNWDSVYSDWSKGFYYDSNGNLHAKLNLVGDGEISAYGSGSTSNSGLITIVDNLTSTATDAALSANQGRVLKQLIDNKTVDLTSYYKKNEIDTILQSYSKSSHTHAISNVTGLQAALDSKSSTSHTHTISNVTGLQSALDDKYSSTTSRTANTVLAAPNGSNGAATFRKLVLNDLPKDVSKYVDLGMTYVDYGWYVIGLFQISNTYTGGSGTSIGTVSVTRDSGSHWSYVIEYAINNFYSSSSQSQSNQKVRMMIRQMTVESSMRPCTFVYNGVKYAGLVWTSSASPNHAKVNATFAQCTPFFVRYYNSNSGSILNSEIYNSIRIDDSDIVYQSEYLYGNLKLLHGNVSANTFVGTFSGNATSASKVTNALSIVKNNSTSTYNGSSAVSISLDDLNYLKLSGGTLGSTSANATWLNLNSSTAKLMMCSFSDGANYIESVNATNTGNAELNITGKGAQQGSTLKLNFATITTRGQYTNIDSGNYNTYAAAKSHTHAISDVTDLQTKLDDKYSSSVSRTANTVLCAPNASNGAATFRKLVNGDMPASVFRARNVSTLNLADGNNENGVIYIHQDSNATLANQFGSPYGSVLNISKDASSWQLGCSHNNILKFRQRWWSGGNGTWSNWRTILHSANYNSYSPSLTGSGASGTWSIAVTGNAGSATKLQTSRTIWGQSFNGTADITGDLYVTNVRAVNYSTGFNIYPVAGEESLRYIKWGGDNAPFTLKNHSKITFDSATGYHFNNSVTINVNGNNIQGANFLINNTTSNPYLKLGTGWYVQSYNSMLQMGSGHANSIKVDGNGNLILPANARKICFSGTVDNNCIVFDNSSKRLSVGSSEAKGFNVGSLLISSAWADYTKVPTNGIYSKGNILSAGDITAYSDKRLKSNIQTLHNRGYITPVTYTKDGRQGIGFIAQEVREKYPELVYEDNSDEKYLSLNYSQYTAVLQAQIIDLKKEIENIKKELTNN